MFDEEQYLQNLHTFSLGRRLYHFESVDSTNSFIINKDWKRGAIAVADVQTNGKGRSGRNWVSESGNAYFSFSVTHLDKSMLMPLNIIIGYAVCDVLRKYTSVYLKWPNDCVASGKKICGILLEASFDGINVDKLAVGIGINLFDINVPKDLNIPVTSLETQGVPTETIIKEKIIADILNRAEELICKLEEGDIEIEKLWRSYSANLGKNITIKIGADKKGFTELGIAKNGALIAETIGEEIRIITSDEVGYDFGD